MMSKVYPQSLAEPYVSFGLAKTTDSSIQLLAVSGKSVYVGSSWVPNTQPVWDGSIASIQNNAGNHGAVPGSLCYVYAYVNSGSLQLEVSDHTYTTTAGYAHKVGNTSKALVGSVYFGVAGKILSIQNFAETVSNQGVSTFPPVDNEAYALRNGMYEKIQQSNLPHLFVELNQRTFATPILDGGTLSGTTYTGTAGGSNPSVSKLTYPKGIGAFPDASNTVKQHTGRFIVNVSDIPTEGKSVYLEVRDDATPVATVKLTKTASGFTLSIVTPLHNETVSTSASLSYVVELSPSGIILKTSDNLLGKLYAFNLESTELVLNLENDGTSFPVVDIDQDLTSSWYPPTVKYPLLGDTSNTDRDILTKYAAELQSITPCLLSVLDTGSLLGTQFLGVADSKFKDGAVLDYAYGAFVLAPAGGIPDAPSDGKQYARKDGDWEEVSGSYLGDVTKSVGTGGDFADLDELQTWMNANSGRFLKVNVLGEVASPSGAIPVLTNQSFLQLTLNGVSGSALNASHFFGNVGLSGQFTVKGYLLFSNYIPSPFNTSVTLSKTTSEIVSIFNCDKSGGTIIYDGQLRISNSVFYVVRSPELRINTVNIWKIEAFDDGTSACAQAEGHNRISIIDARSKTLDYLISDARSGATLITNVYNDGNVTNILGNGMTINTFSKHGYVTVANK